MSRTRTLERRKEREQQRKRQRQTAIVIGLVVVAIAVVGFFIIRSQPAEAPIPAEAAARYEGLPQSETDEGFPMLGSDDAPVKVVEYASFDCTHCREFHDSVLPTIIERVRAGEVQYTYVPLYNTGSIANGLGAAQAAMCVGEQGKFWEFHDALFTWQGLYANTAFSQQRVNTGVDNIGINRAQWDQCMGSSVPTTVLDAALRAGQLQNIAGTPTVVVNGTVVPAVDLNTVNTAITQAFVNSGLPAASIDVPAEETTPEAAEATSEATTEPTEEAAAESTEEPATESTAEATAES
jgi:protein-disulfide isomerase